MQGAQPFESIARQRPAVGVEGVRRNERNSEREPAYEQGMVKIARAAAELNNVRYLQIRQAAFLCKRACTLVCGEKIIKNSTPVQEAVRSFALR